MVNVNPLKGAGLLNHIPDVRNMVLRSNFIYLKKNSAIILTLLQKNNTMLPMVQIIKKDTREKIRSITSIAGFMINRNADFEKNFGRLSAFQTT